MAETQKVELSTPEATPSDIQADYDKLVEEGIISDETGQAVVDGTPAKEDETPATEKTESSERPSWLPEKFKTPEEMAKAYQEAEKKLSEGKADETDGDSEEEPEKREYAEATEEERQAAQNAVEKAGLNLNDVSQEWFDNGGLKEETYTKLSEAGYPKEMVDTYIEGLTNRTVSTTDSVFETVGGEEKYDEMALWASKNYSEAEIVAYDKAVNSNNKEQVMMAVRALKARYDDEVTSKQSQEPEEEVTGQGGVKATGGYDSLDEYMEDMADPRYDTNETYRNKVIAKLAKSPNLM